MKGQSSTEFFLYLTLFMFIVIAAFVIINYMQTSEIPVQKNRIAKETGEGFANVITLAVRAGPGFSYTYYFPKTVYGAPYNISFTGEGAIMEWENEYGVFSYYFALPGYSYDFRGCVSGGKLVSTECSNILVLNHTTVGTVGDVLIISQES